MGFLVFMWPNDYACFVFYSSPTNSFYGTSQGNLLLRHITLDSYYGTPSSAARKQLLGAMLHNTIIPDRSQNLHSQNQKLRIAIHNSHKAIGR